MKSVKVQLSDMLDDAERALFEEEKELHNLELECSIKRNRVTELKAYLEELNLTLSKLA